MVYPVITALAAGILVNLQMMLMIITGMSRYEHKQGLGGDQPRLLARVRSHGNLAENAAIVLIILALLEMSGVSQAIIAIAAALFVAGRLLHPVGLFKTAGTSLPRALGVASTALIGVGGGLALLYIAAGRLVS